MTFESSKDKKENFKTIIWGTIGAGILILSIQFLFFSKSKVQTKLEAITNKLNNSCPHLIDNETLVQSINASLKNKVVLNIALTNISKSIFQTESFRDSIHSSITRNLNQDNYFKPLYEENVTIDCNYYDKNAELLFERSLKSEL